LDILTKRGEIFGEDFVNQLQNTCIHKKETQFQISSPILQIRRNTNLISNPNSKFMPLLHSKFVNPILAYTDCITLESNWEKIINILEIETENKPINLLTTINRLKSIYIFKNLSELKLMNFAKLMQKRKYNAEQSIIEENTCGDEFFMITKGRVKITQNGLLLRECEEGNCFGEVSLIYNEQRTATVTAITSVVCYVISKNDFDSIIDKEIRENLKSKIALQNTSITISDLYYLKTLGKGRLGLVMMVHNKRNFYALKAMKYKDINSKSKSGKSKLHVISEYIMNEKNLKLILDHPFIQKTVKTLKNEEFLFFLNEFINGKNFLDYLNERKMFKNLEETKFYTSCLITILEYLHKKNICHRDFQPGSIMMEKNGYLKMIDFGTAKFMNNFTHTTIGTPHYMAPEVILGQGYSTSCDFWSLGVSIYQIFFGSVPFGKNNHDVLEIYREILNK
jgi:cGMP-dependent protein kinase